MTDYIQLFDGGAVGDQITQLNSGYNLVSPNGSPQAIYTQFSAEGAPINTLFDVFGGQIAEFSGAAGVLGECRYTFTGVTAIAQQLLCVASGAPTASVNDVMQSRSSFQSAGLRMRLDGTMAPLANGSEIGSTGARYTYPLNEVFLIDQFAQVGATSTSGTVKTRYKKGATLGTTEGESILTNVNTGVVGTNTIDRAGIGKLTAASVLPGFYVLRHFVRTNATDYIETPLMASAGNDITNVQPWQTVLLNGIGTGTWTQVSGPDVTASWTGTNPKSFIAPRSKTPYDMVFAYGGDQVTVSVLAATDSFKRGGLWVPSRLRKIGNTR